MSGQSNVDDSDTDAPVEFEGNGAVQSPDTDSPVSFGQETASVGIQGGAASTSYSSGVGTTSDEFLVLDDDSYLVLDTDENLEIK